MEFAKPYLIKAVSGLRSVMTFIIETVSSLRSVTTFLFIVITCFSLKWVDNSYRFAWYAMTELGQVYTMSELSEPIVRLLLGTLLGKIVENSFEHNDGGIFGRSNKEK